jgi:hypothetical protein
MDSTENAFDWRKHMEVPLLNREGDEVPSSIIEETMQEVRTLEDYRMAVQKLVESVFLPQPTEKDLQALKDLINRTLGNDI